MLVRIVGRGRAGGALFGALARAGWATELVAGHDVDPAVCHGADAVVLAVPDAVIASVARSIDPDPACAVLHLSGALGLEVLEPHERRGSVHPLLPLAGAVSGAEQLHGAWFAVDGDPIAAELVDVLEGHRFAVASDGRAIYHAAAVVASNHLVALLGQVERLAAGIDIPAEAFVGLIGATLANVASNGAAAALTGPVSRGDWDTVRRHLEVIGVDERPFYRAAAIEAARLVGQSVPDDIRGE